MKEDIAVLFVDDEKPILSALKRNLVKEPYQKLFADSAAEALKIIDKQPIQVIVCDMKMPHMNGLELLQKVRRKSPQTVRLVLSGYTDVEQLIGCINNGEIFRYLTKSFDLENFKQTIDDAIEHYHQGKARQAEVKQLQHRYQAIEETLKKHQLATDELLRLSSLDILTSIPNRQSFEETVDREWHQARRNRNPLSMLLINIDALHEYTGSNGQIAVETCLQKVAWALRKIIRRPDDQIARFDDEKFAVLLPGTDNKGSVKVVERILKRIKSLEIENPLSPAAKHMTVSIGMVCKKPALEDLPITDFLTTANMALYAAQKSGHNRWIDMSEQLELRQQ